MNVSLTPQLERLIQRKVKTGMYQTASEVVREALRLLDERDAEFKKLKADIQEGLDQIERGEYTEHDDASLKDMFEDIKTRGRKRLAEQKRKK